MRRTFKRLSAKERKLARQHGRQAQVIVEPCQTKYRCGLCDQILIGNHKLWKHLAQHHSSCWTWQEIHQPTPQLRVEVSSDGRIMTRQLQPTTVASLSD